MKDRVKFYTKDDLSTSFYIERINEIDNAKFPTEPSIIDLLEYNNIICFYEAFSESKIINSLTKSKVDYYTIINKHIEKYINNIETIYDELTSDLPYFIDEYLMLLAKYNRTDLIDKTNLKYILSLEIYSWENVLNESVYRKLLKNVENYIDLIKENKTLAKYISMEYINYGRLSLVAQNKIEEIIESYINISVNSTDMKNIENSRMKIDASIKLKARRKKESLESDIIDWNHSLSYGVYIEVNGNIDNKEIENSQNTYIEKWNFDKYLGCNKTSFINYDVLFSFLSSEFELLSPVKNIIVSEYNCEKVKNLDTFFATEHNSYLSKNHMYNFKSPVTSLRLMVLIEYIKDKINIYQFLNYAIDIILPGNFFVILDSENYYNYSLIGINKHLCIQIDFLLSEYSCLVKYNEINKELIELNETNSIDFTKYKSFNNISNIYPKNGNIYFQMIDNQSGYSASPVSRKSNLFDDIYEEKINQNEYQTYEDHITMSIENLISQKIVKWSEGLLVFCDKEVAEIMRALFEFGAININFMNVDRKLVEEMLEKKLIEVDDKLFNKFECEYFHYILNNKDHNDSLALRNYYLHTGEVKIKDEDANIYLIKALLEVILKINLELKNIQKIDE